MFLQNKQATSMLNRRTMVISETTVHLKAASGSHAIVAFKVLADALKAQPK
ncbi:hypothetical protein ACE02P_09550 [Shewanella bicestrii]